MQKLLLHPLNDADLDRAYDIIEIVSAWLNNKGIKQWLKPLPRHLYDTWQAKGWNYAYYEGSNILGIVSLVRQPINDWQETFTQDDVLCISTLAVHPKFFGRGIGRIIMKEVEDISRETLFLTCVNSHEFLPEYYQSLGYRELVRSRKDYGEYGCFDMVLMCKERERQ